MTKYKTRLEEFTLEELKAVVDGAPAGWEEYGFESEDYWGVYTKGCRYSTYVMDKNPFWCTPTVPDYRSVGFSTREDIFKRMDTLEFTFSNIKIEISEFVNEVKFVDGKIYLDIDKEDIEGVIKLLEEKINE